MRYRPLLPFIAALAALPAAAADIVLTPPSGGGVVMTDAVGSATRLRVGGDGTITLPTLSAVPVPATGLCVEIATGKVGTCSIGTLTSITAGTGLSGGTITTSGTIAVADGGIGTTQLANGAVTAAKLASSGCTSGQVLQFNGAAWVCATPSAGTGAVSSLGTSAGSGIMLSPNPITTTGTIAADTTVLQSRVSGSCPSGSSIRAIAADGTVTCQTDNAGPTNAFVQGGSAFTAEAVIGTTDNFAVDVRANGLRAMRYEPNLVSPNVIGGSSANGVTPNVGVRGAVIGGGGAVGVEPTYAVSGPNRVTDGYGTVGGGLGNRAGDDAGASSDAPFATVGGGQQNTASGGAGTVGGGRRNTAGGFSATVPGGEYNQALGTASLAAGSGAVATAGGQYTWSDGASAQLFNPAVSGGPAPNQPAGWASPANTFNARATGGVWFVTGVNPATGIASSSVYVNAGSGTWLSTSDRATKENFEPVDSRQVLARIVAMPIAKWNYLAEGRHVRHLGPTSQDFRAAFGLGPNDKTIATVDADGVALAAIQGLYQILVERDLKIERQRELIAELQRDRELQKARMDAIERAIGRGARLAASKP